jgi:hypothetical protein
MSYTKTQGKDLNLSEKNRSDGSELIPAEVQVHIRHDDIQPIDDASSTGYTLDDEGLVNNYAIEPEISASAYPSQPQQRRYVLGAIGAALLVVALVLISFAVS